MKKLFKGQAESTELRRAAGRVLFFRYSLYLVAGTMAFNNLPSFKLLNSYSVVLLGIAWTFESGFSQKLSLLLKRPLIMLFAVFYLLFCIGMLYTSDVETGSFNLEKKVFLLVIPLFIGTSLSYGTREKDAVLKVFVGSCCMATIICLITAASRYAATGNYAVFFHEELTDIIEFHPPYFGMYLSLAIVIIVTTLVNASPSRPGYRIFLYTVAAYLFIFVILLSARMATLFLFLLFTTGGIYLFYTKRKVVAGVATVLLVAALTALIISRSDYLLDRFIRPLTSDISVIEGGGETGLSIRLVKWKCSLEGFFEAPLLGKGTGDAINYLVACYEKENFWGMYPQYRYNSHNQYLQTALTLGLPGLTAFLLCLALPLRSACHNRDYLFICFISLFGFCALTESLLERQWGIVFFSFFISVFRFSAEQLPKKR